MNKLLGCIFVILLVTIMLNYELTVRPEFEIIQTSLADYKPNMLSEKMPIIIQDQIVDVSDLVDKLFKYLYLGKSAADKSAPYKVPSNVGRLAILQSKSKTKGNVQDTHISLRNPLFENTSQIILHEHQVMIIPRKWEYTIEKGHVTQIILRDTTSYLFG